MARDTVKLLVEGAAYNVGIIKYVVPLDIIWMDEQRTIVHIEANTPPCKADPCPSYGPLRKASTVLEVRAGTAAAAGLKVGDRLQISIPQPGD